MPLDCISIEDTFRDGTVLKRYTQDGGLKGCGLFDSILFTWGVEWLQAELPRDRSGFVSYHVFAPLF